MNPEEEAKTKDQKEKEKEEDPKQKEEPEKQSNEEEKEEEGKEGPKQKEEPEKQSNEEEKEEEGKEGPKKKEELEKQSNEEKKEEEDKEEPKPKEPEIKIPTDFSADIAKLNGFKTEGNAFIQTNVEAAIKKYVEGHDYYQEFIKNANKEREYNPQVKEMETVDKLIMSNLALGYTKQSKYEDAIKYDKNIITIDPHFDKSYVRLYQNYKALNNMDYAVYFGNLLRTLFTSETTEKHKELIAEIESEDKKIKDAYEEKRKTEAKNYRNDIIMKFLPAIVLGIAGLIYFLFFRKPAPVAVPGDMSGFNNTTSLFNESGFGLNDTQPDADFGFNATNSTE